MLMRALQSLLGLPMLANGEHDLSPHQRFPIRFIDVDGMERSNDGGRSWSNADEVAAVVDTVKQIWNYRLHSSSQLGKRGTAPLALSDIGVMTPYREQVVKLRDAFRSVGMSDVNVGTVQDYQGKGMRVIVISTVRTSVDGAQEDGVQDRGLVLQPKCFNVALTRVLTIMCVCVCVSKCV